MSDSPHLDEIALDSELVFDGHFLQVHRDKVRLPNGQEGEREYIQHPGAVMIIPQFEDGRYLMENQYRYPFHKVILEFPAGKVEPNEDPLYTAKRELEEETGYCARSWKFLTAFHPIVSYTSETIYMFLAQDLYATEAHLDDGEFIETLTLSPEEAMRKIKNGQIRDGKTLIALFWMAQLGSHICPPL